MTGILSAGKNYDFDESTGWREIRDTWTYSSATLITIPSDGTTKYSYGDRLRLKQGGSYKYFYILTVTSTTLAITGGSDYTLANSAITDIAVSRDITPVGFPSTFAYTPTWSGFSVNPTGGAFRFSLVAGVCTLFSNTGGGTSNSTSFAQSLPINAKSVSGATWNGYGNGNDNTSNYVNFVMGQISSGGNAVSYSTNGGLGAWTASGTKNCNVVITYPVN